MAHKKGVGSSDNGRDSKSKRLGVKLFGGQYAIPGNIIIRQRGTRFHPGVGVGIGRDHTLYALAEGTVTFNKRKMGRTFVSVLASPDQVVEDLKAAKKKITVAETPKVEAKVVAEPKATVETSVEEKVVAEPTEAKPKAVKKADKGDNLKMVEGVGPKIEGLLHDAGIVTFKDLSEASVERIQEILDEAGPRYKTHNPGTWPKQAEMAAEGKWDELKEWQDSLNGGVEEK